MDLIEFILILLGAAIVFFFGYLIWDAFDKEAGPIKTESGVVVKLVYSPSKTMTGVGYAATGNGGGPVVTTSTEPESYSVIFRCSDHGDTFRVESNKLFGLIKEGQKVKIKYREIRRAWINRGALVDYDFIGTDEGNQ